MPTVQSEQPVTRLKTGEAAEVTVGTGSFLDNETSFSLMKFSRRGRTECDAKLQLWQIYLVADKRIFCRI